MVDGFDFAHFDEPILDIFGGCDEHSMSVILRLSQYLQVIDSQLEKKSIIVPRFPNSNIYRVQIFNTSHHTHSHFSAIGRRLWARI